MQLALVGAEVERIPIAVYPLTQGFYARPPSLLSRRPRRDGVLGAPDRGRRSGLHPLLALFSVLGAWSCSD